jgi:hypothetical protein
MAGFAVGAIFLPKKMGGKNTGGMRTGDRKRDNETTGRRQAPGR